MTESLTQTIHEEADVGLPDPREERIDDNDHHWAVALLRYGVDVHRRGEGKAPRARQLLEKIAQAVYGREGGEAALGNLMTEARQNNGGPTSWLEDADGDDREKILAAAALMYLANVDHDWSQAQKEYLSSVIPLLSPLDAADLHSWIHGTWPQERYRKVDSPLQAFTAGERELARECAATVLNFAKQNRRVDITPEEFEDLWEKVDAHISEMRDTARNLGPSFVGEVNRAHETLQRMRQIRIVVLGEFNVGKSTIINRILGRADFMPTDGLPSTSGIIEVKRGEEERFWCKESSDDSYEEVTNQKFRNNAGDANAMSIASSQEQIESSRAVQKWKVDIPEPVLTDQREITVVDTPGLNEDPLRDELSRQEARTAHAAVLVMDVGQPLTQYEQKLLDVMAGQIRGLTIVLNKVDTATQDEARRAKDRVLKHLESHGLEEEQIVLFNAEAPGTGESLGQDELIQRVHEVALRNVTPVRYGRLLNEVDRLKRSLLQRLDHYENQTQKSIEELEQEKEERDRRRKRCKNRINTVEEVVRQEGKDASRHLAIQLDKDWSGIMKKMKQSKSNWSTDRNPLWSPKKAAKDIAEDAERNLVGLMRTWAHEEADPIVEDRIESTMKKIQEDLEEIAAYIEETQGVDAEEVASHLIAEATGDAFDNPDLDFGVKEGFQAALMTVVSAAVGYIVADVVLYYLLSAIAGFLNPWLLAAAAVAGLAVLIISGREAMYRKIRNKVADKIEDKLTSQSVKDKLRNGVQEKVEETFEKFGRSIRQQAISYVEEAEEQLESVVEELRETQQEREKAQRNIQAVRKKVHHMGEVIESA